MYQNAKRDFGMNLGKLSNYILPTFKNIKGMEFWCKIYTTPVNLNYILPNLKNIKGIKFWCNIYTTPGNLL